MAQTNSAVKFGYSVKNYSEVPPTLANFRHIVIRKGLRYSLSIRKFINKGNKKIIEKYKTLVRKVLK